MFVADFFIFNLPRQTFGSTCLETFGRTRKAKRDEIKAFADAHGVVESTRNSWDRMLLICGRVSSFVVDSRISGTTSDVCSTYFSKNVSETSNRTRAGSIQIFESGFPGAVVPRPDVAPGDIPSPLMEAL